MENFILKKLFAIGLIAAAGLVSGEAKDHWFFGEDYGELLPGSGGEAPAEAGAGNRTA